MNSSDFRMRHFANEYDINTINVDEINTKVGFYIDLILFAIKYSAYFYCIKGSSDQSHFIFEINVGKGRM